jgi:hypothetical protein
MKGLSLYHIEDELQALVDSAPVDESLLPEYLADLGEASAAAIDKRDRTIQFIRHLELIIEGPGKDPETGKKIPGAIDAEIKRLQELKKTYAAGLARVEGYVLRVIESVPERKQIEGSIGILKVAKNPDKVAIEDFAALPPDCVRMKGWVRSDVWAALIAGLPEGSVLEDGEHYKSEPEALVNKIAARLRAGVEVPGADMTFGENRLEVK